jgi:hypothetical protein
MIFGVLCNSSELTMPSGIGSVSFSHFDQCNVVCGSTFDDLRNFTQVYFDQYPELAGILGFKMINDPVNNLQIRLLEGADSLINFALAKKFDEHLLTAVRL